MGSCLRMTNLIGIKLVSVILVLHSLALYSLMFHRTGKYSRQNGGQPLDQSASVSGGGSTNLLHSYGNNILNTIKTNVRDDIRIRLEHLISRRAGPRDPELIVLVKELMDPPSRHMIKPVKKIVETPQSVEALRLLKGKRKGFFVEAGALDGERSSNTIFLEQRRGWTGLLIEMDPYYYTQLMGKSRRSWSINACISPYQYPVQMQLKEASGGTGKLIKDSNHSESVRKDADVQKVPCFTLETMLLALNQTRVDYFSLDVEGMELEVLQTIPFDKLNITVLSVEYVHGEGSKKAYEKFMSEKGYRVHRDIHLHKPEIALYVDDFIFVKNSL